jgi:voltage-gated potassium channel
VLPTSTVNRLSNQDKLRLLRPVGLFVALGPDGLVAMAGITEELNFAPGVVLARQGRRASDDIASVGEFVLLVDGWVRVEKEGAPNQSLGPGAFFGELALLDGSPAPVSIVASTAVKILTLHRPAFLDRLQAPGPLSPLLAELGARLRRSATGYPAG